jgi:hypothetical protein
MIFDYAGDRFYTVLIHEYRDGLVVRETCYCSVRSAGLAGSVGRPSNELRGDYSLRRSIFSGRRMIICFSP